MKKLLSLFVLSLLTLATSYGQAISPYLAGQNAWLPTGYGGAVYNGQLDVLWPIVQKSKVQMIRIGGNGVEFNMPSGDEYISLIDSIRRIGAEPMVQVSEGRGKYTAERAAGIVDYVNNVKKRNVKYWVIGNEPNLPGNEPTVDAAGVAVYMKAWSTAMKLKDPSILIVGPECAYYDNAYYPALVGGANDITGKDENGNYYVDVISFHTYPFNGTQNRDQVLTSAQNFAGNVDNLIGLMNAANAKHGRTGANALQWALTEFNINFRNPANNTVEGVGVHSFLNGQYWAEVFNVGMQKGTLSIQPWSIHESGGARVPLDLGYLDGIGATIKPRSSYYHEMLIADNFRGNYLAATDNQTNITAFGSVFNDTTSIMLLNKSLNTTFDFTLQLSDKAITTASPLKVNLLAGIDAAYTDKISGQSTLVLLFDKQGKLLKKIVYSVQQAAQELPPRTLAPGEELTLVSFAADKTLTCVTAEEVTFTASVLGDYDELTWNFGEGATPQTATGPGPVKVTYSTLGGKNVTLTLKSGTNPDVVERKDNYVQVRSCVRTPFLDAPVALPGLVKAVEFDKGGQGVAYNDSDVANQGALRDPTVARADEAVDTEKGDGGIGNIGYTAVGEWVRYSVAIQKSGIYTVTARIAALNDGGALRILVNGVDKTGVVAVPKTTGFADYQNLVINNVALEAAPNATLQVEVVQSGFNLASLAFAEGTIVVGPEVKPATIVVNRVYNGSNDGTGAQDATELLVIEDKLDIRNLIVKDFDANITTDNGGKYRFNDIPFWQSLRAGTTIVLRKLSGGAGYAQDTDPSDFTLDLLLENAQYLTNVSSGNVFNITQTDMVVIKTGEPTGVAGAIHAFATRGGGANGVPSAIFQSVNSPKLVSPNEDAGGDPSSTHYPLNPAQQISDYDGAKGAISKSTERNWGFGFGPGNIAYIQSLRGGGFAAPSGLTATSVDNRITLTWTDNTTTETGFEVVRSLDDSTYTLLATVAANTAAYTDSCLRFGTRYSYQVRAKSATGFSEYSAAAGALTGNRPTVSLPALTGACSVTVTPPSVPDNCGGTLTGTTTDSLTYAAQGTYTVTWRFDGGNGDIFTASQTVTVLGVQPAPVVSVSKADNTFTGLDANTIALGYGAQTVTLTASNGTSAPAATTYAWSPAAGLSDATSANPVFTPTAAGTYAFNVTATNEFGCEASATVTVTVIDVRCGNGRVAVCHKGRELCLPPVAVAALFRVANRLSQRGFELEIQLGSCAPLAAKAASDARAGGNSADNQAIFETFPNPVAARATVHFRPVVTAATQVQVYNPLGQLVATLYDAVAEAGRDYEVTLEATSLPAGVYTCRLLSKGHVQTKRVVVVK